MEYLACVLLGLLLGFLAGIRCEGNRWKENADRIQRIEWRGSLYKVQHDK